jgi:hypothetical protein
VVYRLLDKGGQGMSIRIKLKEWDIVVLPLEGKVLGRARKDGTRKEILAFRNYDGYCGRSSVTAYPESTRSRIVWYAVNGPIPPGMQINHKNHVRHDDRIENLELVTPTQNNVYQYKSKRNTSGYKGASFDRQKKKYRAYISISGRLKQLGYFTCPIEAARAYDRAALELHGKFAILNFPEETPT